MESISLKIRNIIIASVCYLTIPVICFFFGFCRLPIAIGTSSMLVAAICLFFNKIKKWNMEEQDIKISVYTIIILAIFVLITGQSKLFLLSGCDIPWRNAIYQDLINYEWPVFYETNKALLTYYLTYWLVPALICWSISASEFVCNLILYVYTLLGAILIFLLVTDILMVEKKYSFLLVIIFIFWSGNDFLGVCFKNLILKESNWFSLGNYSASTIYAIGIEHGYVFHYVIRTMFESIGNVYNQYICLAISTLIFVKYKSEYSVHALLGLLALPYSPLGFIGLFFLMVGNYCSDIIKKKFVGFKSSIKKDVFSITNVLAVLSIAPIFYFYFSCNAIAQGDIIETGTKYLYAPFSAYGFFRISLLYTYYLMTFGIYAVYIMDSNKNNILYYLAIILLLIIPLFKIGDSADLIFNASISPFIVIMLLVTNDILKGIRQHNFKGARLKLLAFFCIATLSTVLQIGSSIKTCVYYGKYAYIWDAFNVGKTLEGKKIEDYRNFLAHDYEQSVYYRYIMKR